MAGLFQGAQGVGIVMIYKPVRLKETRYDRWDKFLTIGFHPDNYVRKGDIVKVVGGKKYPYGSLLVVDHALIHPFENKDGDVVKVLLICCKGGEIIPADNVIICAMSKTEIIHYHPVKKKIHKRK